MTHVFHQTKFRWTENLTSRFIQLRKENGNLFTGRKYSAQAGWEHILQKMRQEFPTIMADVHYRVLKKKWSNLLQQYKELKNPVHGDKNKSDDVSWPFYGAIDEILGANYAAAGQRIRDQDQDLNPHEFLCLSVTPDNEDPESPSDQQRRELDADYANSVNENLKRIRNLNEEFSIEIERLPREVPIRRTRTTSRLSSKISQELRRRRDASEVLVSRLPPATELSIKTVRSTPTLSQQNLRVGKFRNEKELDNPGRYLRDVMAVSKKRNGNNSLCNFNEVEEAEEEEEEEEEEVEEEDLVEEEEREDYEEEEEEEEEDVEDEEEEKERPRKLIKRLETRPNLSNLNYRRNHNNHNHNQCNLLLEKRFNEFMEYTKRRDDENRIIMTRILNAVERIADK